MIPVPILWFECGLPVTVVNEGFPWVSRFPKNVMSSWALATWEGAHTQGMVATESQR